ncbi:SPRY_PRY_C-I_1 domain-containing protein isoform X1 [Labeo rohita]|uniref:SPRY_PRY_C-I_1 domain-containing protein isoform X1 n=1 Tax=Labeo rohita TaxID=84645 RepID=UPI0021E200EA|nr:SPRY_PRY_C-I_1 domain-containing protein isoform X1 [Labeo rohita]
MAFAAENQGTLITLSEGSLQGPHTKRDVSVAVSYPFIKPDLKADPQRNIVKIIKYAGNVFHQWIRGVQQNDDLRLDESKYIIRELAAELDRVVQSKILVSQKLKNKGTTEEQEEEQQYYILQWAEDVENIQTKQTDQEEKQQTTSEQLSKEIQLTKAKKILSELFWQLKDMKQNSVRPNGEWEETLRDLHKEWKQGESSILPVMDCMMWTVLQSKSSEDSVPRQWVKSKQRSKNTGEDCFGLSRREFTCRIHVPENDYRNCIQYMCKGLCQIVFFFCCCCLFFSSVVGLCIPNPVWNWITRSTADVVLDPNTANPDLLVSEDGKYLRAKKYGHESWKEFQIKRSKFDGWTCVQAKEGYNTGHHYWEVDVRKKHEWRVGVVKESALRNGYVTMNTKAGYWNLRLQLGTLMALTEPVTKLNLLKPSKIGVYLNLEEGHVSFYDAEKRRHIYTFNTECTGKENIYPMFGTVETDRALMISS